MGSQYIYLRAYWKAKVLYTDIGIWSGLEDGIDQSIYPVGNLGDTKAIRKMEIQ